jgi:DNA-binding transcriptional MerR regulator
METLNRFKDMSPCPAEALVAHLGELLPRLAGPQERYKVTEVPTLRTLRFYAAQGLLDKPVAYQGRTALYGYRHLLQAVVIKVLQANLLPLRKIREMLQGLSNAELERFLEIPGRTGRSDTGEPSMTQEHSPGEGPASTKAPPSAKATPPTKAPSSADSPLPSETPALEEAVPSGVSPDPGAGPPLLQELLNIKLKALPAPSPQDLAACKTNLVHWAAPAGPRTTAWRRLEVEPGIELHLRQDITLTPGSRLEVLMTRIKYLLTQENPD